MLNWASLDAALPTYRRQYRAATPFPHVVLHDLFTPETLDALQAEWPPVGEGWRIRHHLHSRKATLDEPARMPTPHVMAISALNGTEFRAFLEVITGRRGLEADPALYGGGLHVTERGGFLDLHCDFSRHPTSGLQRVLNLLVYLTPGYQPAWGGGLELGELDAPGHWFPRIVRTIAPVANRAVLFATSDRSWHGHTVPWASDTPRISLALYYYAAVVGPHLPTTHYVPLRTQYWKRLRKTAGRALRATGWR